MKKTLLFTLFVIAYSCSPKIKSSILSKQQLLKPDTIVLIVQQSDDFENDGIEIGTIKAGDNGFSMNCSYEEVLIELKHQARQSGANVIKITSHKSPDLWSTCTRIKATLYKVPDIRKHENEIKWSPYRKLTWEDFKGSPKLISNNRVAAQTYCGIQLATNRVTNFKKAKLFIKNIFDCNISWVRPELKENEDLLLHEQKHFDLSEIYARQLRKEIKTKKLNVYNLNNEINPLFKKVYAAYLDRQEVYDMETRHGLDKKKQSDWNIIISTELRQLDIYAK